MTDHEWLSAKDVQALRTQGAPILYIRALGRLPSPPSNAKHFDFSTRYGVFQNCLARRSLGGAKWWLFETRDALNQLLGEPRSIKDPTGSNALWLVWKTTPGWTMSVSADQYPSDPEWFTTALLIHRRFSDQASQAEMDKQVKIALWGTDEAEWPGRPYTGPVLQRSEDKPRRHRLAALFDELDCERPQKNDSAPATAVPPKPEFGAKKTVTFEDLLKE